MFLPQMLSIAALPPVIEGELFYIVHPRRKLKRSSGRFEFTTSGSRLVQVPPYVSDGFVTLVNVHRHASLRRHNRPEC